MGTPDMGDDQGGMAKAAIILAPWDFQPGHFNRGISPALRVVPSEGPLTLWRPKNR